MGAIVLCTMLACFLSVLPREKSGFTLSLSFSLALSLSLYFPCFRPLFLSISLCLPSLPLTSLFLSPATPYVFIFVCRPHLRLPSLFYTLNVRGTKGLFILFEAETTAHEERKRTEKKRELDEPKPSSGSMLTRYTAIYVLSLFAYERDYKILFFFVLSRSDFIVLHLRMSYLNPQSEFRGGRCVLLLKKRQFGNFLPLEKSFLKKCEFFFEKLRRQSVF